MVQSNFHPLRYFRFAVLLVPALLLLSCNQHHLFETNPEITIYQTSQQPDILPALAVLDLQSDSENTRKFIETRNWLERRPNADSLTVNIEKYLLNGEKTSLFRLLTPNINKPRWQVHKPLYKNSSFLGFSNPADTMAINRMLNDSGLLQIGSHITWASCENDGVENALALALLPPNAKQLNLKTADVKEVVVKQANLSHWWQWYERLTGESRYSVTVILQPGAIDKVQTAFADDSALLIKCRFENKEIYCSTVSEQVAEGFTVLSDMNLR